MLVPLVLFFFFVSLRNERSSLFGNSYECNISTSLYFIRLVELDFGICFFSGSFVEEKSFRHELIVQIF